MIIAGLALLPTTFISRAIAKKRVGQKPPNHKACMRLPRFVAVFECMRKPMSELDKRLWSSPIDPLSRLVAVQVFALFTLYPTLIASIATIVNCSNPVGGKRFLLADLTVTCYEGWHIVFLSGASCCFVMFGCGVPFLVFQVTSLKSLIRCRRNRREEEQEQEHASDGEGEAEAADEAMVSIDMPREDEQSVEESDRKILYTSLAHEYFLPKCHCKKRAASDFKRGSMRTRFGFLFHGYNLQGSIVFAGWEANVMLRKLCVTLAGTGISDPYLQIIAALMILIVAFGLQSFFQPYETTALNILDSLGIFCLLCTQILSILYLYTAEADSLPIDKATIEIFITFGLFALNIFAVAIFLFSFGVTFLELDWRIFRCRKRVTLRVVSDPETFAHELAIAIERELDAETRDRGTPEEIALLPKWWRREMITVGQRAHHSSRGEGRVVHLSPMDDDRVHVEFKTHKGTQTEVHRFTEEVWRAKFSTRWWRHPFSGRATTRGPELSSDTTHQFWSWHAHGEKRAIYSTYDEPHLLELVLPGNEVKPGDSVCMLDLGLLELSPIKLVTPPLGGISLFGKKEPTESGGNPAQGIELTNPLRIDAQSARDNETSVQSIASGGLQAAAAAAVAVKVVGQHAPGDVRSLAVTQSSTSPAAASASASRERTERRRPQTREADRERKCKETGAREGGGEGVKKRAFNDRRAERQRVAKEKRDERRRKKREATAAAAAAEPSDDGAY